MGLRWGITKKHAISGKKAISNRIVANRVVISGVDIIGLSSNARV